MRNYSVWSISLGRWAGVHVRLHAFFLLFAVFVIYLCTINDLFSQGLLFLIILLASVVFHEIGHSLAAMRAGGQTPLIVIGPLGGLSRSEIPHDPGAELMTALAGPMVNLAVCLLSAALLWACAVPGAELLALLNPLYPSGIVGPMSLSILKLTFWTNWVLLLVNALPAFPLDGGRVLRSLLWPKFGYRTAVIYVSRVAKVTAVLLLVLAVLKHDKFPSALVPAWLPLTFLLIYLYFSANQEVQRLDEQDLDEDLFGYDFSQGYTSLERDQKEPSKPVPGPLRRWLDARRKAKEIRQRLVEEDEDRRMDEILARLHETGIENLPPADREILNRVSKRLRNHPRDSSTPS